MSGLRGYTRWTRRQSGALKADILSGDTEVVADAVMGQVRAIVPNRPLSPDEARMIGVRLIEAAALADGNRAIRAEA